MLSNGKTSIPISVLHLITTVGPAGAETMLAKLLIELVRSGERDPERIRQEVLGRRS